MRKLLVTLMTAVVALALAAPATAATVTLFGGATQQTGAVQLVSNLADTDTANNFSGIRITGLGDLQLSELKVLASEFNVTDDGCGGGSPRFVLILDDGRAVNVAFGPAPSFTGCTLNAWQNSGNLIGQTEGCRWHVTSPPALADPCMTLAEIEALGARTITEVLVVVDSGWFFTDQEQTILIRNVLINRTIAVSTLTGLNPSKACKAQRDLMGPAAFAALYGTATSNQKNAHGKCVSAMAHARSSGTLAVAQATIMSAAASCKADGKSGRALGACVKAQVQAFVNTQTTRAGKKGKKRP